MKIHFMPSAVISYEPSRTICGKQWIFLGRKFVSTNKKKVSCKRCKTILKKGSK